MSITREMDTEDVVRIYSGIPLRHKRNKTLPFTETVITE